MSQVASAEQIDDFLELFDGDVSSAVAAIQDMAKKRQHDTQRSSLFSSEDLANDEVAVSVDSVSKIYKVGKQKTSVLRDVSLTIHKGEFVALTGASGSGKSTLLQLIGGLDQPTSGTVTVNGININQLNDATRSEFRNKTIGFVFQFFYLQPFLKIAKNIEVPGMFAHTPRKSRVLQVEKLMQRVGLSEQELHLPKQLSGGQIQRVAIARALLNNPKILLADEPTGNLDSANSKMIVDLFQRIREELGMTVLIVTHNPEIAAQADREIHLKDGVIV